MVEEGVHSQQQVEAGEVLVLLEKAHHVSVEVFVLEVGVVAAVQVPRAAVMGVVVGDGH